jgi:Astacin (Peptidase family M12A).
MRFLFVLSIILLGCLLPNVAFVNAVFNFTRFDGDIIPTYKSILAGYGVEYANELVNLGLVEAIDERSTAPTLDLWKQNWNEDLEMWEVFVYVSTSDYSVDQISTIRTAIRRLQKYTGVIKFTWRFTKPTDGTPFLHVGTFGTDICSSYVGVDKTAYTLDGQFLFIGISCLEEGQIQHELLHALGFFHEHSRPDRDNFVKVREQYIQEGKEINFQIGSLIDSLGTAYDYGSVMHYGEYQFTNNPNRKTINAFGNEVGQRERISWMDNVQMRLLYQCRSGSSKYNWLVGG